MSDTSSKWVSNLGLRGPEKLQHLKSLINELSKDRSDKHIPGNNKSELLAEIKVYGREQQYSDPIYTPNSLHLMLDIAFDPQNLLTSRQEALSIVANAMFLVEPTRKDVARYNLLFEKLIVFLQSDNPQDEFLLSRIIFLLTYLSNQPTQSELGQSKYIDWSNVLIAKDLGNILNSKIEKWADKYSTGKFIPSAMQTNAIKEFSTLIFNLAHFNPAERSIFSPCTKFLFKILDTSPPNTCYDQPYLSIINSIYALDETLQDFKDGAFPPENPILHVSLILEKLHITLEKIPTTFQDTQLSPLISLLQKLYQVGPESVKVLMKEKLLPMLDDRSQVLGKTDSLPSSLIRLSMSSTSIGASNAVALLLFTVCDSDGSKLISSLGFGVASGLLVRLGIPLPDQPSGEGTSVEGIEINPITGQRLDNEIEKDLEEMTEEEKEREAEKLFVLFERLNKTGVISVENPVRTALEQGRIHELNDHEDQSSNSKK